MESLQLHNPIDILKIKNGATVESLFSKFVHNVYFLFMLKVKDLQYIVVKRTATT